MKSNTMVVREFDVIMSNYEYSNSRYKYLESRYFNELMAFVRDFQSNSEDAEALDFMKIGYKKGVRDTISLNNYVGLIELPSGFQIEILPKVDLGVKDDINATRKVFLRMLRCLRDFNGKSFSSASLGADKMNLYEVFISMYTKEAEQLVKKGLKSSYNQVEDNLQYIKGKIDYSKNIKVNLAHKEKFYCIFDDYSLNRTENKIIKTTLLKLLKKSGNEKNIQSISRLLPLFEMVNVSNNIDADFSKIIKDRNSKEYSLLMEWSKIFLKDKSFTTFSGINTGKALLFPMESIYEEYVATHVKKVFGNDGWSVSAQDRRYYLFDTPKKFSLRPDIVVSKNNITVVMDTKWKRINNNPLVNYGISQSDMYQMYAYSKKYAVNGDDANVYLLYPYCDEASTMQGYQFISNDNVQVTIYLVDVENVEASLMDLKGKITKS